jgi:hypothetical protein
MIATHESGTKMPILMGILALESGKARCTTIRAKENEWPLSRAVVLTTISTLVRAKKESREKERNDEPSPAG